MLHDPSPAPSNLIAPPANPDPVAAASGGQSAAPGPSSLDQLASLSAEQLRALYQTGSTPRLAGLIGDLPGRMLVLPSVRVAWLARALRAFAAWRRFPWRGKSFTPPRPDQDSSAGRGEGINRVFSDVRPRRWFRFETFIAPSRAGNFDALHLDYDHAGNPFFIRAIEDEIRKVGPDLFLGQAYLVIRKRARLVLYFALTAR